MIPFAGFFLLIVLALVILLITRQGIFSFKRQRQLWILGGYLLILLFSLVFIQLLPDDNFVDKKMDTVSQEEFDRQSKAHFNLFPQAMRGNPEQVDGVFIQAQWEFPFHGNLLTVALPRDHHLNMIVERKDTADSKIEVTGYATRTIVEMVDFSGKVDPPRVSLEDNTLRVADPEFVQLRINSFRKDFVVTQVSDQVETEPEDSFDSFYDPFSGRVTPGTRLLYVRIPADVEISSKSHITFVDKEYPEG